MRRDGAGAKPQYVLFDSWYGAASVLHLIADAGWCYVTRAKKNRLLAKVRLDATFRTRYGRRVGKLNKIRHESLIVKDGKKYFLTNDVQLSSAQVKHQYRMRQQIEEVFRLLKQEYGWGRCRVRSLQGQKAHLHLGLYAFCLVQERAISEGETQYAVKRELLRAAIPTQKQFLEYFTAFA